MSVHESLWKSQEPIIIWRGMLEFKLNNFFFHETSTRVGNSSNWVNYSYMTECKMCCSYGFAVLSFMMEKLGEFADISSNEESFLFLPPLSNVHFKASRNVFFLQPAIMWEFSFNLTFDAVEFQANLFDLSKTNILVGWGN